MNMTRILTTALTSVLLSATVSTAEWTSATLEGTFRGSTSIDGDTSFSFGLGRPTRGGGDVSLRVFFDTPAQFRLRGARFVDLGPLSSRPTRLITPKIAATTSSDTLLYLDNGNWYTSSSKPFALGHYYHFSKGNLQGVVYMKDFSTTERKVIEKHWYGDTEEAKAKLEFEYVSVHGTPETLTAVLQGTKQPEIPARKTPVRTEQRREMPQKSTSAETQPAEPLFREYEGFQKNTSAFLDLPLDQVSVVKCDQLIDTGTAVKSKVGQEISLLHEQIREATADVEKYKDRIDRISNLQLKDRVTTKINQLEANNQERRVNLKQWEARQNELDTSLRTLREYRDILK